METKTPKRTPTPRQRKAAKAVVENLLAKEPLPTGQILENIGYSQGVAATPKMVLETEGFKEALADTGLRKALESQGINPKKIAEKIGVLLDATKSIFTATGEMVDEVPDYQAIDKGISHATKIYGLVDESEKPKSQNTYNFIFSPEVQADVREIEARIKAKLIKPHDVPEN